MRKGGWEFVQDCVDSGVRVICINDNIDTADENWEVMMHTGSLRHGMLIPETRRRVRRTASVSFDRGGRVLKIKFGYRKLSKEEAASGVFGPPELRIAKRSEHTATIRRMREMVLEGWTYACIAAWLNEQNIALGPYVEAGEWTARHVIQLLRDPILMGTRSFGSMVYTQIFRTGKISRQRNPAGPKTINIPELAHLTSEEYMELLSAMDARKRAVHRAGDEPHPLRGRPRSRSYWPGQHMRCNECRGLMYMMDGNLKCQNVVPGGPRTCWNHVQIDVLKAREKILTWLIQMIDQVPGLRQVVEAEAIAECSRLLQKRTASMGGIEQQIAALERESAHLAEAIAHGGPLNALVDRLKRLEEELAGHRQKQQTIRNARDNDLVVTKDQIADLLETVMSRLMAESFEFADLLRRLMPKFVIRPVQVLDTPLVRPRAHITLSTQAWVEPGNEPMVIHALLDLFDPPVHIRHVPECVAAKKMYPTESVRQVGERLGLCYNTVHRALVYEALMEKEGLKTPYRELHSAPANASRWKPRRTGSDPGSDQ